MKALLVVTLLAMSLGGPARAADKSAPAGDKTAVVKTKAEPGCAASYKESQRAVNAKTRWSYFKDTVREVTVQPDGSAWVSFNQSSQRFQIPAAEAALLASAKKALEAKAPVHVAVEESEQELTPSPDVVGKPSQLKWLDAKEQHPSCR